MPLRASPRHAPQGIAPCHGLARGVAGGGTALVRCRPAVLKLIETLHGDEAILFGPGLDGEPTAADWAELLGTIHYEVVTSPRGRVLRTYRGGDADG